MSCQVVLSTEEFATTWKGTLKRLLEQKQATEGITSFVCVLTWRRYFDFLWKTIPQCSQRYSSSTDGFAVTSSELFSLLSASVKGRYSSSHIVLLYVLSRIQIRGSPIPFKNESIS